VIRVTIVGAGHYARSIVASKYVECPRSTLRSVISPRSTPAALRKTPLAGLPLARDAAEWRAKHGAPGDHDLFDLCVHPAVLLPALRSLVEIGAQLFVLPKPLATTRVGLDAITVLLRDSGARAAVASQWYYSQITATVRQATAQLARPFRIEMDFSQRFKASQLEHYTPHTALLPHMLQILHTAGLWRPDAKDSIERRESQTHFRAEITASYCGTKILLNTDIDVDERRRMVTVTDTAGHRIEADFLGVFNTGVPSRYPAVAIDGCREEIAEDNIAVMVRREIAGFLDKAPYLAITGYLPVNDMLLLLCGQPCRKTKTGIGGDEANGKPASANG
jgi:hypothetical protein